MRRTAWTFALGLALVASAAALTHEPEDDVQGLRELREDLFDSVRTHRLDTAGPWELVYAGPMERGTRVRLHMEPEGAFKTYRTIDNRFKVELVKPRKLFTAIIGDIRPIGVKIIKTFEEPGIPLSIVTFQTKEGKDIPLEKIEKLGLIRRIEANPEGVADFVEYEGIKAKFRRRTGHENTPCEIVVYFQEEGLTFVHSAWLPRIGDEQLLAAVPDEECREERVFSGARLVTLRTPWLTTEPLHDPGLARIKAKDTAWDEILSHCQGTLGGEIIQDSVKLRYDFEDNADCDFTHGCKATVRATYQCKIRQYETVQLCN